MISPFSRGGYVCSETFDHISVLKFIEARFGVPIPNVSGWRLGAVGDMTSALALSQPPSTGVPSLPPTSLVDPDVAAEAVIDALTGTEDEALIPYPAPTSNQGIPAQETSPARIRIPFLSPVVSGTPGPVHKSGVPERSGTLLAASNGARSSAQGANRSTSVAPGSTNGSSPVTRPIGPMGPRVRHALGATHPGGGDDTGLLAGVSAAGAGALASAALFVRRLVRPAGATSAGSASGPTKPEPGTGDGPTGG